MVIFGAAGDLTKRLVVPALYNLVNAKRLPDGFRLVGVDLTAKTVEEWREGLTDTMKEFVAAMAASSRSTSIDQAAWRWLADRMSYLQGDLNDPEPTAGSASIWRSWTRLPARRATIFSISPLPTASSARRSPGSRPRTS